MTDHKWVYPPLKAAWEIKPTPPSIKEELERDAVIHAAFEWLETYDGIANYKETFAAYLSSEEKLAATLRPLANRRAAVGYADDIG